MRPEEELVFPSSLLPYRRYVPSRCVDWFQNGI